MSRTQNRRRGFPGSRGYSLVEVIVAMLISCVMVSAVMSVAVTAKMGSVKGTHRQMFDQGIAQISAELKGYVTACGCDKGGACPAPGCTTVLGPNINRAGVATWYMNGAVGPTGSIVDSPSYGAAGQDVWALKCGDHYLTGVLNGVAPNVEAAPYLGYIKYTVTWPGGSCAGVPTAADSPNIAFAANWTEP